MEASERLPQQFNIAAHFVDGNVAEGGPGRRRSIATTAFSPTATCRISPTGRQRPARPGRRDGGPGAQPGRARVPGHVLGRHQDRGRADSREHADAKRRHLYFLNDSRARVAVISAPLLAEVGPVLGQARFLKHVLIAGGNPGPYLSYEDQVARASARLEAAPTSRDDAAFWLYSSGSTGSPRAPCTCITMDLCRDYAKQVLGIRPTDRVYSAAKLFFAYGLGNAGYSHGCGRSERALSASAHAGGRVRDPDSSPTDASSGSPPLRGDAGREGGGRRFDLLAPFLRLGRGGPAPRRSTTAGGNGSASRFSTASGPRRSCTSFSPIAPVPCGQVLRQAGPRL